ncbi:MAG: Rrf2 family transcriptional regulator [Spirochaetales bacterium]|nr:Rrf2 family transcriptional regulator [Spirochaetales bacterium]
MISRALDYALRSCLFMANRPDQEFFNVGELALQMDMSRTYLGKVLQKLVHIGYLRSMTGPTGGFALGPDTLGRSLLDFVYALDGEDALDPCLIGLSECDDKNPCPVHANWLRCKTELVAKLKSTTVADARKQAWPLYMKSARKRQSGRISVPSG